MIQSPPHQPWDIKCEDESLTKQEFLKDCDINNIIARCVKSGLPPPTVAVEALVGVDLTNISSYQDCLNRIAAMHQSFYQLDPKIRSEFDNDPGKLLAFIDDDSNYDRAVELGLIDSSKKSIPAASQTAPVTATPTTTTQ